MRNRAKCDTIVESKHRHDFVTRSCGSIFVDVGDDYHRAGFKNLEDFIWLGDDSELDGDDS